MASGFPSPPVTCGACRDSRGPFRYKRYADKFLEQALRHSTVPVKQAVISPSALSLMYPADGIADYSREEFIEDLVNEHVTEVRRCLDMGAHCVQIDFTEARFAIKIDPTGALLASFIDLNNLALARLTPAERLRVGVHTCPGAIAIPRTAPTCPTTRCCRACSSST